MPIDFVKLKHAALLVPAMVALHFSLKAGAAREVLADPPMLRGTVNLTIGGGKENRTDQGFSEISGLTLDESGRIFVADADQNKVHVYSSRGAHEFSMGKKGAGPGDFATPTNIAVAPDGMLWVRESGNKRFSIMRAEPPAGAYTRNVPFTTNLYSPDAVHWDADGRVVAVAIAPTKEDEPIRIVRRFIDATGVVAAADTGPPVSPDSVEHWVIRAQGSVTEYNKPFGMQRVMAFGGPGMAAYATNTNYAVQLVDARGQQVALISRAVAPVALSPRERGLAEAARERFARSMNAPAAGPELDIPTIKPVIESLGFDLDGRLWVERAVPDGKPREADVYDKAGMWVAVMQWPAKVMLAHRAVRGNTGLGTVGAGDGAPQQVARVVWK